jgi:hypothetical protein
MTRNEKILALRGKKSFTLIAREFGITRNAVAGVMWRADWQPAERVACPSGFKTKCGLGHHGGGKWASERLPVGGAAR